MILKNKIKEAKKKHGVYFIAELGQNHQGDIRIAKQMVDRLVGSGVSAIKTAKRNIDISLTTEQKLMRYDNPNSFGNTYYEHRKALELSYEDFLSLKQYSEGKGFDFISSFTDISSLDYLETIGVDILKIASSRVTDYELLKRASFTQKNIILSTGMSTINNIEDALNIFKNNNVALLQCTSCYPCAEENINLRVIEQYKQLFPQCIGYGLSGHHASIAPDIAAYCMGVDIIERHFTLNRSWKGTDHAASLSIDGINYIMKYIGQIKEAMGTDKKDVLNCELPAIDKLRKI